MKKNMLKSIFVLTLLTNCEADPIVEIQYVEVPGETVTVTETQTVIETVTEIVYVLPEEYSFTRNGIS
ncbi:MAG: hypothetical protein CMC00_04245, partial [Flavobacteriaceae bacterium]|nr:hypothetical protein [Flavobacteriaceae bacterium]